MKIHLIPYCFTDTPEELEAKKEYYNDSDGNGIPDHFDNGITPSYQEKQKLNVVNVESLLWGDKKSDEPATRFAGLNYESVVQTDEKVSNNQPEYSNLMFINLSPEESQNMDYLYEITKPIDEHYEENIVQPVKDENDLGIIFNDDEHYGMPLEEFPTEKEILKTVKKKNKSKYWPDFKPDYKSREYQKKLHMN